MIRDLYKYNWMLPVYNCTTPEALLAALLECVISPAEAKVAQIQRVQAAAILNSCLL